MRRRTILALACAAAALASARRAPADDSVFGIRGLGLLSRPLSARAAGTGGAFALFDAATALNPSTLGLFRSPAGWAASASSWWRYSDGPAGASLSSTRFPLFGFASPVGHRLTLSFSAGDYLDRTWAVQTSKDSVLRGDTVTFEDDARSQGGVTDLRLGAAYVLTRSLLVGVGLHALSGSTRRSVERSFSNANYTSYGDLVVTDFSGLGVSLGAQMRLSRWLALAATARVNSRLEATATNGASARIAMPAELTAGLIYAPVVGSGIAVSLGYQTWARSADDLAAAEQERSRSVWSLSVGAESENVRLLGRRVPVRVGYRWRQLPFPVNGAALDERALSGGFGLVFSDGRASVDLGVDSGRRTAGAATERFTTVFVGVTVRP